MPSIADAFIAIKPDLGPFEKGMKDLDQSFDGVKRSAKETGDRVDSEFKGSADKSEGHFKNLALKIAGAFAGLQVGDWLKGGVAAAQETEKLFDTTEQIIKSTGGAAGVTIDQVTKLADQMSRATAIDDADIVRASNSLLAFQNVGADVFNEALGFAGDLGAVMGTDLQSATKMLGKALNDPAQGLSALSRAGIQFSQVEQDDIKSMVEMGNVTGAQIAILDKLQGTIGGTAAASATGVDKMKFAWGELQESAGTALSGAFNKVAPSLLGVFDKLTPIMERFGGTLGKAFESLAPIIEKLATALGPIFDAFDAFIPVITPIIDLIATELVDALNILMPILEQLFEAFAPVITQLVDAIKPVLPIIAEAITKLFEALSPLIPIIAEFAGELIEALAPILPTLAEAFLAIVDALMPLIPPLTDLLKMILPPLTEVIKVLVKVWKEGLEIEVMLLTGLINGLVTAAEWLWKQVFQPLGDFLGTVFTGAWNALRTGVIDPIIVAFDAVKKAVEFLWHNVFEPVISYIGAAFTTGWNTLRTVVIDPITTAFNGIKGAVEFLWHNVFEPVMAYIGAGFKAGWDFLKAWVIDPIAGAFSAISSAVDFLWHKVFEPLLDFFKNAFATGFGAAKAVIDGISTGIQTVIGWVRSLIGWVQSAIEWLKELNPFAEEVTGKVAPGVNLPGAPPIPTSQPTEVGGNLGLQRGGIIDRVGRYLLHAPEVVIPLSMPGRAMQLLEATGLNRLAPHSGVGQLVAFNGPVTFYDPSDVNTVSAVVLNAYEMAGA